MSTYTKKKLSGSTDGMPIKIAATATKGTAIHTAVNSTTEGIFDEIWLWAFNSTTVSVVLTIEFGGVSVPDQNIVVTIPSQSGLYPVVPGLILQNAKEVTAFAGTTNVVTLMGFVNSIGA